MEQKALCESASIIFSAGKATVSLEASNVVQALVNSLGLPSMQTAFPHMACPQITLVTSSHLNRLRCIRLSGAGKQACQLKINVTVEMSTSGLIMAAFSSFPHVHEIEAILKLIWLSELTEWTRCLENIHLGFRQIIRKHSGMFSSLCRWKTVVFAPLFIRLAWVWSNVHSVEQIRRHFLDGGK